MFGRAMEYVCGDGCMDRWEGSNGVCIERVVFQVHSSVVG